MNKFVVLADDLTGASDCGVQFSRFGFKTSVLFDLRSIEVASQYDDVISIDTDTRSNDANAAYQKLKNTVSELKKLNLTKVFKKIDSGIRGNIGHEIDAIMDEIPFDFAVFVPASPKLGRTTIHGIHYMEGVPIAQTEFANDPKFPVLSSDLRHVLYTQTRRKADLVNVATLDRNFHEIEQQIEKLIKNEIEIIVFDAVKEEHLEKIVQLVNQSRWNVLWVGSAGLSEAVAKNERDDKPENVLVVSGSLSKKTKTQIQYLVADKSVAPVVLHPENLTTQEMNRCKNEIVKALQNKQDVAFTAGDVFADPYKVSDALGQVAAEIISAHPLQGLVLTGGDTAKAVCHHLGVSGIQLFDEVEAGIPIGRFLWGKHIPVVTKAGSFGSPESITKAVEKLKRG